VPPWPSAVPDADRQVHRRHGTLSGLSREEAEAAIIGRGGKSPGSVSARTTAVVVGDSPWCRQGDQGRGTRIGSSTSRNSSRSWRPASCHRQTVTCPPPVAATTVTLFVIPCRAQWNRSAGSLAAATDYSPWSVPALRLKSSPQTTRGSVDARPVKLLHQRWRATPPSFGSSRRGAIGRLAEPPQRPARLRLGRRGRHSLSRARVPRWWELAVLAGHRSPAQPATGSCDRCRSRSRLAYAHRRGLVHRDSSRPTSSSTTMVDFSWRTLVLPARSPRRLSPNRSAPVMGTARYASPEQVEGRPVDDRTDVYSLRAHLVRVGYRARAFRRGHDGRDLDGARRSRAPGGPRAWVARTGTGTGCHFGALGSFGRGGLAFELETLLLELDTPEPLPLNRTDLALPSLPLGLDRDPTERFGPAGSSLAPAAPEAPPPERRLLLRRLESRLRR